MITRIDRRFTEEATRFKLRCTCASCAAFDEDKRSCAYGYPTDPHRTLALVEGGEFTFCKAFELA